MDKALRIRGIKADTIITPDNGQILLEKGTLSRIANAVSALERRKLSSGEIGSLIQFVRGIPQEQFYQQQYDYVISELARMFRAHFLRRARRLCPRNSNLQEISDHLYSEVMATSNDEHQYKITADASRIGQSVVDIGSKPKVLPTWPVTHSDFVKEVVSTLRPIRKFLDPAHIDTLMKRARSASPGVQTFGNITFPHRLVPFDSRNRDLTCTEANKIRWKIHYAGMPGYPGDIRLQDTLKEIIRMKICPFWIPTSSPKDYYYGKIRMFIEGLWQSAVYTEFTGADERTPITNHYHFEMLIKERVGNRLHLFPVCNEYTFSKPVARIETLVISFRSPFQVVVLEDDRGIFTLTPGNPTLFTLTSGAAHNLFTGDLIYILNAATGNTALDAELNSIEGHIITRINDTQLTIEVDSSMIVGDIPGVILLYGSKRIEFQIEFTSLEH